MTNPTPGRQDPDAAPAPVGWHPADRGHTPPGPSTLARVGQVLAILVVVAAVVVTAVLAMLVIGSITSGADRDPHGYGRIFGSIFLVPTAVVGALALPFVARADQRRGRRWALNGAMLWIVAALGLVGYALFVD